MQMEMHESDTCKVEKMWTAVLRLFRLSKLPTNTHPALFEKIDDYARKVL